MAETAWLRELLRTMQADIEVIKADVKTLSLKDAKTSGMTVVICFIVTLLVNGLALWLRV